jgi:hypothetical protein
MGNDTHNHTDSPMEVVSVTIYVKTTLHLPPISSIPAAHTHTPFFVMDGPSVSKALLPHLSDSTQNAL